MKIKILLLAIAFTTAGFAETIDFDPSQFQPLPEINLERDSFAYIGVGLGPLPLPVPSATLGFRTHKNHFGFDTGLNVATIGVLTHLKGFANVLLYPKPSQDDQFYMGLGACGGPWFYDRKTKFTGAMNIVLGREFSMKSGSKSFFQADIAYPSYVLKEINYEIPFVTLSYGWGF